MNYSIIISVYSKFSRQQITSGHFESHESHGLRALNPLIPGSNKKVTHT